MRVEFAHNCRTFFTSHTLVRGTREEPGLFLTSGPHAERPRGRRVWLVVEDPYDDLPSKLVALESLLAQKMDAGEGVLQNEDGSWPPTGRSIPTDLPEVKYADLT